MSTMGGVQGSAGKLKVKLRKEAPEETRGEPNDNQSLTMLVQGQTEENKQDEASRFD